MTFKTEEHSKGVIMAKVESQNEICLSCGHYNFCSIYWGPKCKRQGGLKIPRMKSRPVEERQTLSKQYMKQDRTRFKIKQNSQAIKQMEPIRTKMVNW